MKRKASSSSKYSKAKRTKRTSQTPSLLYKNPSFVNRELDSNDYKVTDTLVNGQGVTTGGYIISLLTNLTPGSGYNNNFLGQKINPVGIKINWEVVCGDATNLMRIILFQWFDSTPPLAATVLQNNCLSPVLIDNRENTKVLRDELVSLALPSNTGNAIASGSWYVKSKRIQQAYYNANANIWQKGNLYLLFISDSIIAPSPTISYYSRVTFLDA